MLYVYGDHGGCLIEKNSDGNLDYSDVDFIFEDEESSHLLTDVRAVDGDIVAVGILRVALYKKAHGEWQDISIGYKEKEKESPSREIILETFEYVSAFSVNDIYAAGRQEDWIPLDVTDQFRPKVVCCASDGYVYIAGAWGMVRGRNDEWQTVTVPNLKRSLIFTSIASYQGKIFLGSEMKGTYVIDHNSYDFTPYPYKFEDEIPPISARYMDAGYGMLLVANGYQVALHDGEKWIDLYGAEQQREREELEAAHGLLLRSSELLDDVQDALDDIDK